MNTNIILSLDTRRVRKDNKYPIIFRLSHKSKTLSMTTGYAIPEKFWDVKNRKIKNSYKELENVTRVNNFLGKEKARFIDVITKLKEKGDIHHMSINEIKEALVRRKKPQTFFVYTEKLIKDFRDQKKVGNARVYETCLKKIKKFRNEVDFTFEELNYQFLKKLEAYHYGGGYSTNGLSVYMRTLRAIFNRAIKDKIVEKEAYPFNDYTIKNSPTSKRAIEMEAIDKIRNLDLKEGSALFKTRHTFMMSFYLMGASFTDLAHLKVENIVDGRIQYRRQKTGKFYDIKISKELKPIIEYYMQGKEPDDYLLPIIKRTTIGEQYRDVLNARKRYNKRLKDLAKEAGIQEKLTSYVSRHSFASIANNKAIPVTAISEMLGHQDLKTTQTYLASLNRDKLDEYVDNIIGDN